MLLGRSEELRRIRRLMAGAQKGESGVLLVVGEPGIGKTALLEYAAGRGRDWTVLRARGTETETELPFAGLAELVTPIARRIGDLPEPQAAALAGALALGPPTAMDPFTAYAATLSLIAAAAEHGPVLLLVDDAQWLDRSSQNAILFAARRFQAESIALLVALRHEPAGVFEAADLPRVELSGLEGTVGRRLLLRSVATSISADVADRLVAATGGNPLALKEMPKLLSIDQLIGGEPLPDPLPLRSDLRQLFLTRISRLPAATRRALLVAAANSSGSMAEIGSALSALGLGVRVLEPAEAAGIVEVGAELRFAHPLVRASVYHDASPTSRREAHRALAQALGAGSAARRAWHLAAATVGQDESVAVAMDAAAVDARLRGAHAVAAMTLERAAQLSPHPERRTGRLLGAAEEYQLAGQPDRALALLNKARESVPDVLPRAELDHLRGRVLMNRGPLSLAHEILADAAHAIEDSHPTKAAAMLSDASLACFMGGQAGTAEALSRRAFRLSGERDDQAGEVVHLLFTGMLVLGGNWLEAVEHVERERRRIMELQAAGQWQHLVLAGIWLMWAEENTLLAAILDGAIDEARRLSAPGLLPLPLAQRSELAVRTGDWAQAYASSSEAVRLAQETGQTVILSYARACLAWTLAGLGREAECRAEATAAMAAAAEVGSEAALMRVDTALGLLELGAGRAAEAVRHLRHANDYAQAHGIGEPTVVPYAANFIEALLRAGRSQEAEEILGALEDPATGGGRRLWTQAVVSRSRGMLAPEGAYDEHFNEALGLHEQLPARFEWARTKLAYGERLRRSGLRVRGREQLRAALEEFERLGAAPWAARARAELRAAGESGTPRRANGIQQLTPQELQVALAVAGGSTNREVAASLFLSPKTIEFHLGNIYSKLEIRSRTQLVSLVDREAPQGANPH